MWTVEKLFCVQTKKPLGDLSKNSFLSFCVFPDALWHKALSVPCITDTMWTVCLIVSGVVVNTAFKTLLCESEVWIYIWRTQWFICCFFNVCFGRAAFFYFLRWHIVLLSHGTSGNVIGCFRCEGGTWWPTCELGHRRERAGRSDWYSIYENASWEKYFFFLLLVLFFKIKNY